MIETTVFMNNRTQAVRLPTNVRFNDAVKKVVVRVVGNERIISPVEQTWDNFFFGDSPRVSEDFMQTRDDAVQAERENF